MKFSKISSAVSSAFNTTTNAVKSAAVCTTEVVVSAGKATAHAVVAGATLSLQIMWAVTEFIGNLIWWFVTLPINLFALMLLYILAYVFSRRMANAAEYIRFENATVVNGEATTVA